MKTTPFKVGTSLHDQMCLQAHDLSREQCRAIRDTVTNNYMPSEDYKMSRDSHPFLQGYNEPYTDEGDKGWVLVEFWTQNREACEKYATYLNQKLGLG